MSLYKGTTLIAGNPDSANTNLSNITDTAKIAIAHNAIPSDTYEILTLGTSGNSYTAPADGWFFVWKVAASSGQYIQLLNTATGLADFSNASGAYGIACCVPVSKGDIATCDYTVTGNLLSFRFIYANGSESEAI